MEHHQPQRRQSGRQSRNRSRNRSRTRSRHGEGSFHIPHHVQSAAAPVEPPKTFFCQLAHGGPTIVIPTPNNLTEVYQAIAAKFDGMTSDDILYCTVNTFKPDMDNLLTTNLKVNDFIYAHCHGTPKEVTLKKTDALFGVTLTDNGNGKVFIRKLEEDSVAAENPAIAVGDHIQKIGDQSVVGSRHYKVAAMLRSIPVGEEFTLRLVGPKASDCPLVNPRSSNGAASSDIARHIGDGKKTLRFNANGQAVMQEVLSKIAIDKVNAIFETYLGFNDDVLAMAGWELASKAANFVEMKHLFAESDLGGYGFPDELLFDLWGAVDDFRKNRMSEESGEEDADEIVPSKAEEVVNGSEDDKEAANQCQTD